MTRKPMQPRKGPHRLVKDRYVRISLLVQQGREGLVDQEAEDHVQHSLEEGEGILKMVRHLMRLSEEGRI